MDTELVRPYEEEIRKRTMLTREIPGRVAEELIGRMLAEFIEDYDTELVAWSINRKKDITTVERKKHILPVLGRREASNKVMETKHEEQDRRDVDIRRPGHYR